jgi:hypothetical protein
VEGDDEKLKRKEMRDESKRRFLSVDQLLNIIAFFIVFVVVVVCHEMIIHTVFKLNIKIILHLCHFEKAKCSGTWKICAIFNPLAPYTVHCTPGI